MNRNIIVLTILSLLVVSALAVAGAKIKVEYVLEVERDGRWFVARETGGFYSGEKFSLRIKVSRDCYCYLAATKGGDQYRLHVPMKEVERGDNWLKKGNEFRLPAAGSFVLDQEPGVDRLVLIVSEQRIPELEQIFQREGQLTDETIVDVRDRHSPTYYFQKELKEDRVIIYGRTFDNRPTVLMEEIILRHSD